VRGCRPDDLQPAIGLQGAECADDVLTYTVEQLPEPKDPGSPELHQWQQIAVPRLRQRLRRLVARGEPLIEEPLHFGYEERAGELIGEDGRKADRDGGRNIVRSEATKGLEQRQIGVECSLTQPVASMGPASMVEYVRQVTVQGKNEIH
jgi:hypothetical protein